MLKTTSLTALTGVALLAASSSYAAPIVPVSYTYGANAESQPQPTSFQSGAISDVGNLKLTDDAISAAGGWNDGTHVGFRNDSDNGAPQPRVEFNLGGLYDVSTITIYSSTAFVDTESVQFSSSTDGVNFSTAVSPTLTYTGTPRVATLDVSSLANATHIRMDYFDSGQWAMISEVDFDGTLVPEPSSLALLGLGGLFVARRRRK